jgi:MFS transporter, FSR family, fosmidomycin resistance protein
MGQEYLPHRIGMASGLTVGFGIGIGGVGAVVVGALADRIDLDSALYVAAAMPVVALALALFLPPTGARRRLEPELVTP